MSTLQGRHSSWKPLNLGMLLATDKHAQEYVSKQAKIHPEMTVYDHLLMYLLANPERTVCAETVLAKSRPSS